MVMTFALDYDNTFTVDPDFWWTFISMSRRHGHRVVIVTYRDSVFDLTPDLRALENSVKVYYTKGVAKKWYMEQFGEPISVWIDDKPESILNNSSLSKEGLEKWREENRKKTNEENIPNREPAELNSDRDWQYAAQVFRDWF